MEKASESGGNVVTTRIMEKASECDYDIGNTRIMEKAAQSVDEVRNIRIVIKAAEIWLMMLAVPELCRRLLRMMIMLLIP